MKTPKSFLLEAPKSFVPDEPHELEVVHNEPTHYIPQQHVNYPPVLSEELEEVMNGSPSFWWGWLKRWSIESKAKTINAQVLYVESIANSYLVQARLYAQAYHNHHLRENLEHERRLQVEQQNTALIAAETQYTAALLAKRLTQEAEKLNLPLQIYLLRLEKEWELEFEQKKIDQQLKKDEEQKRIDREDEYDKSIRHIDVTAKAANSQAQLITALHAQVEKKLHELLAIETSEHPDHHKKRLITNKKNEIKRLEVQLERLEEDDRKAGPRPAPKAEAKANTDVSTNFGKVRTIATE